MIPTEEEKQDVRDVRRLAMELYNAFVEIQSEWAERNYEHRNTLMNLASLIATTLACSVIVRKWDSIGGIDPVVEAAVIEEVRHILNNNLEPDPPTGTDRN